MAGPTASSRANNWRVKYDGRCCRCGTTLLRGTPAVWDPQARTIHCIVCPPLSQQVIDAGVAGGSARREYERRSEKRATVLEVAVGTKWGRRIHGWTREPASTTSWATGASGEEAVAAALEGIDHIIVLNDRRVPGTRGNIDHIIVTTSRIYVVDAKRYEGLVNVHYVGPFLRPKTPRLWVGGRDKTSLAEGMTWQVNAVRAALHRAHVGENMPIKSALCFVGARWPRVRCPTEFGGVALVSPETLADWVRQEGVVSDLHVKRVAAALAAGLPAKARS